jgi:hypothetical protein
VSLRVGTVRHVRDTVGTLPEFVEDPLEDAFAIPAGELVVNRVPRPESLGQISPWNAGLGDVEDRVHEGAVGQIRWPSPPTALGWQQGFDPRPFRIAQLVSVHSPTKPPDRPSRNFSAPKFGDRP